MKRVIGIDLGTTNSAVCLVEGGVPTTVPNDRGGRTTPSVVAFKDGGERLVGSPAKAQAVMNAPRTIFGAKRLIGRRWDDEAVQDALPLLGYEVVPDQDSDGLMVRVPGVGDLRPQEISAVILHALKMDAERFLGDTVTDAVITVPAYFSNAQRDATIRAGEIAGLNVRQIINEPTAAALAYGMRNKHWHRVAVYDLGGGTFDVSLLEIRTDVIETLSTAGDTWLGGHDMDDRIVDWLADGFEEEHGIDLRLFPHALQLLRTAAETARIELSTSLDASVILPFVVVGPNGPLSLETSISRAELEDLVGDLIDQTEAPVHRALGDAKLQPADIDEVILVGGTTRMPAVRRKVEELFGRAPNHSVHPDEAVAMGAALQAEAVGGTMHVPMLLDVTPLTLGVGIVDNKVVPMVPRNTTVPVTREEPFTTVVDYQAVIQFDIVQGEEPEADRNELVGSFILAGIEHAIRGVPTVVVSFELDVSGLLRVTARDSATGAEVHYKVEHSALMTPAQVREAKQRFSESFREA